MGSNLGWLEKERLEQQRAESARSIGPQAYGKDMAAAMREFAPVFRQIGASAL
jgi:hypothetical protein